MKKLLLLLSFLSIAFAASAASGSGNLNPFAYDLSASLNQETMMLTVNYKLNAPAAAVTIRIFNGNTEEKSYIGTTNDRTKGEHTIYNIDLSDCPKGVPLTWRVDVTGSIVSIPKCVKNDVQFYSPTSVDIDNNPMNDNFGTVLVVEGLPLTGSDRNSKFQSCKHTADAAGLYVLNADGTPRQIPGAPGRYGYNGSRVPKTRLYFYNKAGDALTAYSPYRVRISDCGRVFITSLTPDGQVLWEADPKRFRTIEGAKGDWVKVMSKDNTSSFMRETKLDCGDGNHDYCGIFNLYNSNSKFIAGPNVGFDVRGSGPNLKLLMLSGCRQAIAINTPPHYYCYEYDLGNKTIWDEPASRLIFKGNSNKVNIYKHDGMQVQYDKDGNIWVCQYTATKDNKPSTLVKVKRDDSYTLIDQSTEIYRRCGGIRFNNDYTQFVVASNETGNGGGFELYRVNNDGSITKIGDYDTNDYTGASLMDFAWDYANNLYIACDQRVDNGQRIAVYAMPRTNLTASTPAKTALVLECDLSVTYAINATSANAEQGTVAMSCSEALVNGKVPSCAIVTVTATPKEHYRFVEWKVGDQTVSTSQTYPFYAKKDLTVTAYFDHAKHNVTWNNLFMKGKDIGTENPHFPGINERLWRMFQARYKDYHKNATIVYSYAADADAYSLDGRKYVRTDSLLLVSIKNETAVSNSKDVQNFMNNDEKFKWLKDYIVSNYSPHTIGTDRAWVYHLFGFFNKTNKIYYNSTTAVTSYSFQQCNYEELGKPEHWAPIWTEAILGLPQTMEYGDYTPIDWVHEEDYNKCPFRGKWVGGWHTNTDNNEAIIQRPDAWYISYKVQNIGEPLKSLLPILAWRNGSTTGEIVTTITGNMDLYATYVDKNIDEYDVVPANPANYDATNNDVIKLLLNPKYSDGSHDVTISRQLQGGMYNTICLPFDVDLTSLANNHPFKGAKAMEFTGVSSLYNESNEPVTVLQFTEVTRLMKGVPYLIQTQSDVVGKTSFSGITYNTITPDVQQVTPNESPFTFHGSINPTEVPEGSLIVVANNRLALTTETGQMAGMRGYFSIDPVYASEIAEQAAAGRVYLNFQKPTTTSIPVAPEAEQQSSPEVYKLLHDGQIYIIRDNTVYTITGVRVK